MTKIYTLEKQNGFGLGGSINGTGRRQKVTRLVVITPEGRAVHWFPEGQEKQAEAHIQRLNEYYFGRAT